MAAAQEQINRSDELSIAEKVNEFIRNNRKGLFIGLIAIVLVLVGLIAGISIRDRLRSYAFSRLDALERRYADLRIMPLGDDSDPAIQAEIAELLRELSVFADRHSGFVSARAYFILADLYGELENWEQAEIIYISAARAGTRSYIAPISIFNAAVAAEEQGKREAAIGLYNEALGHGDAFPYSVRAQFSIGRLYEELNNREAALTAYRNLVGRWPRDPIWTNLAQSRIMILSE